MLIFCIASTWKIRWIYIVTSYLNSNSKYHSEYKFAVKLISLVITSNLHWKLYKNANIVNFVHYTQIDRIQFKVLTTLPLKVKDFYNNN